jgi:hypothetical protein
MNDRPLSPHHTQPPSRRKVSKRQILSAIRRMIETGRLRMGRIDIAGLPALVISIALLVQVVTGDRYLIG